MKYREPVDPQALLASLTLEKLNQIYKSILKNRNRKSIPSEVNSVPLKKKRSAFLIKCWK